MKQEEQQRKTDEIALEYFHPSAHPNLSCLTKRLLLLASSYRKVTLEGRMLTLQICFQDFQLINPHIHTDNAEERT